MTNNPKLPRGLVARLIRMTTLSRPTIERAFEKKENETPSVNDWEVKNKAMLVARERNIPESVYGSWFKF